MQSSAHSSSAPWPPESSARSCFSKKVHLRGNELSHSDRSLQPGRSSCCCSCRGSGVHSLNAKIGPSAHCLLRRTQRHFGVEGGKASARYCGLASSAEERSHSGRKLRCGGGLSR